VVAVAADPESPLVAVVAKAGAIRGVDGTVVWAAPETGTASVLVFVELQGAP
jgi:hypothetical protein